MNCNDVQNRMSAYIDGELSSEVENTIHKHLEECETCAALHGEFLELDSALRDELSPLFDETDEIAEAIRGEEAEPSDESIRSSHSDKEQPSEGAGRSRRSRTKPSRSRSASFGRKTSSSGTPWSGLAAAAAVLVAFVVGLVVMNSSDQTQQPPSEPDTRTIAVIDQMFSGVQLFRNTESIEVSEGAELRRNDRLNVPVGDQARFRYKNENTTIQLKGGTQVTLRKEEKTKRIHLRDGTLEADVAEQRGDRKLVTTMPLGRAEIIGTKFQLSYDKKARLEVSEGTVKFSSKETGRSVTVRQNEYGVIAPDGTLSHGKLEPEKPEKPEKPSKPKNKPPVADAGEDITRVDSDRDGEEQVTLDGSASGDPDDRIVRYNWMKDGTTVATGEDPKITLGIDRHRFALEVVDEGGTKAQDQVTVVVKRKREIPEEGLVGYWPLDVLNGSTTPDHSPLKNHGVAKGNPELTTSDREGKALVFDGKDDYIGIPHTQEYLLNQGTVSVWFKTDDLVSRRSILSKDSEGFDTGGHFKIMVRNRHILVRIQSTKGEHMIRSELTDPGKWHHLAVIWGSGGLKLFLNGSLAEETSYTGGLGTNSGGKGNVEPIVIGGDQGRSKNQSATPLLRHFRGQVDDVRLYNRRLSPSEIKVLAR